jgi:hypothetical protein
MKRLVSILVAVAMFQIMPSGPAQSSEKATSDASDTATVEISSVTVDPREIHTNQQPKEATITVQVAALGKLPSHPEVQVNVGTYSARPALNSVCYSTPQSQILGIPTGHASVTFKVRPCAKSVSGSIVIAGSIGPATEGMRRISPPPEPSAWQAELKLVSP